MSIDPNTPPAYGPAPRQGGGSKIWLFLGLGCGVMLLLCCGVGGLMTYQFSKSFKPITDPAAVASLGQNIASMDIPEGFRPATGFSFTIPFTDQSMTMVVYQSSNGQGGVFLTEFSAGFGSTSPEELKRQMEQSLNQQGQGTKQLQVLETRSVEVVIHGEPATFNIQKAKDPGTNQEYVQVIGVFKGKAGTAMLMAQLPADQYTEDDAEKLIRSIKTDQ